MQLAPASVRWGLAEAEKVYRDDSSAVVMLSISELRALLHLAHAGLHPSARERVLLGYVAKEPGYTVQEAVNYSCADADLRLADTPAEARRDVRKMAGVRTYRIVAEEADGRRDNGKQRN